MCRAQHISYQAPRGAPVRTIRRASALLHVGRHSGVRFAAGQPGISLGLWRLCNWRAAARSGQVFRRAAARSGHVLRSARGRIGVRPWPVGYILQLLCRRGRALLDAPRHAAGERREHIARRQQSRQPIDRTTVQESPHPWRSQRRRGRNCYRHLRLQEIIKRHTATPATHPPRGARSSHPRRPPPPLRAARAPCAPPPSRSRR